jgi:hypothetical protein
MSADVGVVIYMIYNGWTTLGYIAIFFTVGVLVVLSGVQRALALWRFRVIARQIERYK